MSLARATLSGTVLAEPEKRFTNNNIAVTNFTIQVSPSGRNETPFQVRVSCWRNLADTVAQEVHAGDNVIVEGRLQIHSFEAPGGVAKKSYEVEANTVFKGNLQSLGSGSAEEGGNFAPRSNNAPYTPPAQQQQAAPVGVAAPQAQPQQSFIQEDLLTEDDIPF